MVDWPRLNRKMDVHLTFAWAALGGMTGVAFLAWGFVYYMDSACAAAGGSASCSPILVWASRAFIVGLVGLYFYFLVTSVSRVCKVALDHESHE